MDKTLKDGIFFINQIYEIEKKLDSDVNPIERNITKIKNFLENDYFMEGGGLFYHDPLGEYFDETRTDCEASIAGPSINHLKIIEVIKPIIYLRAKNNNIIVQKAIVIVKGE